MSQFDDELRAILGRVDGARAAILMGFDGIPISEVNHLDPTVPLQDVAVEYGRVFTEAMKIAQGNNLGAIGEFCFLTDQHRILVRILDANYYVALFLAPEGNYGKGRYALRMAESNIKALL